MEYACGVLDLEIKKICVQNDYNQDTSRTKTRNKDGVIFANNLTTCKQLKLRRNSKYFCMNNQE